MHISLDSDLNDGREPPEPRAGGRPTLPDSYLFGGLYALIDVFEKSWAEIGWELERIRGARKPPAVEAIRRALEPIRGLSNHYIFSQLLFPSVRLGTDRELRKLRHELGEAAGGSRNADSAVREQQALCEESRQAVYLATQQPNEEVRGVAEREHEKRKGELEQLERALTAANERRDSLQRELQERAAFFAQNEMLGFVREKRYELSPRNLARALAGMPYMRWRQSIVRCKKIPCKMAISINYLAFRGISWILRRDRPEKAGETVQLLREAIPKLPMQLFKKEANPKLPKWRDRARKLAESAQTFLKENWPHLKTAIEDQWEHCLPSRKLPYELTASFIRNMSRPTTALDRILAAQDRIER